MNIIGVIPSRFASTRLPGKPLLDIAGKSLIQRVYEQARKCTLLEEVVVATDDERIVSAVTGFGGQVILTDPDHLSGTDRCAEVLHTFPDATCLVNIQGDEPFIRPEQIASVCELLTKPGVGLATLVRPFDDGSDPQDPNTVKVVRDTDGRALYFSRAMIPFQRHTAASVGYMQHIGIYGYRAEVLRELVKLPQSTLELTESLEQLRWLENGFRIHTSVTDFQSVGVDTPEDLEAARRFARTFE
jgi:3-deoxy-manno-octulosonate cytidylyltransferase (CMP-KDO synthetase)